VADAVVAILTNPEGSVLLDLVYALTQRKQAQLRSSPTPEGQCYPISTFLP
jgi:hypothetical protein